MMFKNEFTCSSKWSAESLILFTSFSHFCALAVALAVSLARLCIFFLIASIFYFCKITEHCNRQILINDQHEAQGLARDVADIHSSLVTNISEYPAQINKCVNVKNRSWKGLVSFWLQQKLNQKIYSFLLP